MSAGLTVVVAGDDLLFSTRIAAALSRYGHRPVRAESLPAFEAALRAGADAVILNLASWTLDATAAIRRTKDTPGIRPVPLLGFCGHADTRRQEAARAAGCDLVATNGEVSSNLQRLLTELLPESSTPGR
jgi:CheY-like chemotaxis protein